MSNKNTQYIEVSFLTIRLPARINDGKRYTGNQGEHNARHAKLLFFREEHGNAIDGLFCNFNRAHFEKLSSAGCFGKPYQEILAKSKLFTIIVCLQLAHRAIPE